jgi:hypothetical protein
MNEEVINYGIFPFTCYRITLISKHSQSTVLSITISICSFLGVTVAVSHPSEMIGEP